MAETITASKLRSQSTVPYVPADFIYGRSLPLAPLFWACIFGLIFGAVTVYVGLRAGLTVSGIHSHCGSLHQYFCVHSAKPVFWKTISSKQPAQPVNRLLAASSLLPLPALIFLGFPLEQIRIFVLALLGGWLGVFFMIPLRRQLIVKEHGNLLYPEGTACADVLIAGDRGGSFASRVFLGLGLGSLLHLLPE